jgi:unsaturated rhamnogalacturonyl hydrolase
VAQAPLSGIPADSAAKYQFHIHIQYLMDSASGLWYHGWEFDGKGSGHNYAKALWGRGNCWATLAIPMFLDLVKLPESDPTRRHLQATLQRQVDGLLPLQDAETGLWRTLLDDPTSYVETSATAGFVGGILMGIRLVSRQGRRRAASAESQGFLNKEKYLEHALDGLKGCIAQVQESGEVANVSKGTPVSMDKDFYKTIPRVPVPYGQSLLIVALGEWLRLAEMGVVSK